MAPFNVHFLIAEKLWPELDGPWQPYYGQFCFGCIAPDVDKLSATLTQKDTHFYDRTGDYDLMASHRTAAFLKHQTEFLCCPFAEMSAPAQAFGLGYLCHLCVDEVSKHMWRRETWLAFRQLHPGSAFAALDELARQRSCDYPAVTEALRSITVVDVLPRIPVTDLKQIWQGAGAFVQAKTVEEEFMALVDTFDRPNPARRRQLQQRFRSEIDTARRLVRAFNLETLIEASLARSRSRLADLIGGRVPAPSFPDING